MLRSDESLEMKKEFLIQVNSYGVWEDVTVIPLHALKNKSNISLHMNSKQIEKLKKHEGKVMRLVKPVIKNKKILYYETKQLDSWAIYRNNYVVCLNSKRNYSEFQLDHLERYTVEILL
jgi:hypothetical protein